MIALFLDKPENKIIDRDNIAPSVTDKRHRK
jgi:hypothetical protein